MHQTWKLLMLLPGMAMVFFCACQAVWDSKTPTKSEDTSPIQSTSRTKMSDSTGSMSATRHTQTTSFQPVKQEPAVRTTQAGITTEIRKTSSKTPTKPEKTTVRTTKRVVLTAAVSPKGCADRGIDIRQVQEICNAYLAQKPGISVDITLRPIDQGGTAGWTDRNSTLPYADQASLIQALKEGIDWTYQTFFTDQGWESGRMNLFVEQNVFEPTEEYRITVLYQRN